MWRVIATDREGREIARKEVDAGEITIGRDADRQLILQSPSVSRRHCRVRVDATGLSITDDGSANGVLINGARISPNIPSMINDASRVEIAEFRLTLEQIGITPRPMAAPALAMQLMPMSPPAPPPLPMQMAPGMIPGGQMPPPMMVPNVPAGASPGMLPDMVRLIAEGGQYNGRVFDLPNLAEITVGRGVGNELVLDDPSMSRKHSKLRRLGNGRLEVEDLNSANGTYVNGRKITTAQLGPGDTLRFGEVMFRLDGGGSKVASPMDFAPQAAPSSGWAKGALFALVGFTAVVYAFWILKLVSPSVPPKGVAEQAISKKLQEAEVLVRSAQEALAKGEWGKAKEAAEKALDLDPANLDAHRVRAQANRAEDDEGKFRLGSNELDKGNAEGFRAAINIFDSMSPDSTFHQQFAEKLRSKLLLAGEEFYKKKFFRDAAETLCAAFRVSAPDQKPGQATVRMMRDAERKVKLAAACSVK